ncbi:NAD+ synthetase [Halobacteroides halobius DSM 5150]|uniref:NH(3)-dependent NAD(+) synthetase n=1 Tax=Halobacteroides halobius (strain ATCC 35273 / DSM 5150 / MD-1) TaxID=748449 RepID=L0KAV0_HALHC|nr:NAD+ synthase [Halobacteroides halobius]AGB42417.1 NAD+ synthetase [Halobacteroides halobius DSM 5150]
MLNKDYKKISQRLTTWIKERVQKAGCKGAVVGLSGGIDSAVTSVLSKRAFPDNTLGIIMPCYSNPQDAEDAKEIAKKFDIPYQIVDLSTTFDQLRETIGIEDTDNLAVANIKPRLRMTTLYYYASQQSSLVVGTDNRSELKLGYFTKYGDGGIDIAPLGNLVKSEVREVAKELGIPKRIITKAPSAGLWEDQTDEDELGITYEEIDRYILTGEAKPKVKKIVDKLAAKNKHKLQLPPIPKF